MAFVTRGRFTAPRYVAVGTVGVRRRGWRTTWPTERWRWTVSVIGLRGMSLTEERNPQCLDLPLQRGVLLAHVGDGHILLVDEIGDTFHEKLPLVDAARAILMP